MNVWRNLLIFKDATVFLLPRQQTINKTNLSESSRAQENGSTLTFEPEFSLQPQAFSVPWPHETSTFCLLTQMVLSINLPSSLGIQQQERNAMIDVLLLPISSLGEGKTQILVLKIGQAEDGRNPEYYKNICIKKSTSGLKGQDYCWKNRFCLMKDGRDKQKSASGHVMVESGENNGLSLKKTVELLRDGGRKYQKDERAGRSQSWVSEPKVSEVV